MQQLKKMGPLSNVLGMLPGMPKELKGAQIGDDELKRVEAIIRSMTSNERAKPEIINGSRRLRIANGSGTTTGEVNRLVKQFSEMQKMMKRFGGAMGGGKKGKRRMPALPPGIPRAQLTKKEREPMAVKLRLTRVGKTKQPQYRIVAADARSPRDGRFIEILGQYNPRTEPSTLKVDNDKAVKWLRAGCPADRAGEEAARDLGCLGRVPGREMSDAVDDRSDDDGGDDVPAPTATAVLGHIVRSIVDDPEAVRVDAIEGRNRVRLEASVGPR